MSSGTITFTVQPDGNLNMLVAYEGGFDDANPAHLAAAALSTKMAELADPLTKARDLTAEEVEQIRAGNLAAVLAG